MEVLRREGICVELESDFLIEMAAEGHGVTILTRALVPGKLTTKLPGDPIPTLTSSKNRCDFLHDFLFETIARHTYLLNALR